MIRNPMVFVRAVVGAAMAAALVAWIGLQLQRALFGRRSRFDSPEMEALSLAILGVPFLSLWIVGVIAPRARRHGVDGTAGLRHVVTVSTAPVLLLMLVFGAPWIHGYFRGDSASLNDWAGPFVGLAGYAVAAATAAAMYWVLLDPHSYYRDR